MWDKIEVTMLSQRLPSYFTLYYAFSIWLREIGTGEHHPAHLESQMLVLSSWYCLLCSPLKRQWLYLLYYSLVHCPLDLEQSSLFCFSLPFSDMTILSQNVQHRSSWDDIFLSQMSLWPLKFPFYPAFKPSSLLFSPVITFFMNDFNIFGVLLISWSY